MAGSTRTTVVLWVLAAAAVALIGGRALLRDHAAAGAPAPSTTGAPAAGGDGAGAIAAAPPPADPVVHVAGAVHRPGVYRLRPGARVQDAVRRAGGAAPGADRTLVNLAAKVADGQQIIVPRKAPAVPVTGAGSAGAPAGAPVSLNAATAQQLDELDGVGPATADRIIAWRSAHGGFASVDDLAEVPGIGPKKLAALRPQVAP